MKVDTRVVGGFAAGRELEVDVARIDEELDALWRGLARRRDEGRAAPVWRACLFNLVVHAGDSASEVIARYLAGALADELPARLIVVRSRPEEAGESLRAWVGAVADPTSDGEARRVSGELVVLEAHGRATDRLAPVVRSVLEPDMVTTLWWTGPTPLPGLAVDALRDVADRVVVDSETWPDDLDVGHLLPDPRAAQVADLAWPRLEPWRRAMTRAFDPPANASFLDELREVRIAAHETHHAIRATSAPLLAGWLAAALSWRGCDRVDGRTLCFTRRDEPLAVHLDPATEPGRGLASVTLRGPRGDVVFCCRSGDVARIEAEGPVGFTRVAPVRCREPAPAEVLARAVLAVRADPMAPEAVRRAAQISATMGRRG